MKPLFAALQFLTILPVPASWAGAECELARSVKFFPVVGLLIGAVAGATAWCMAQLFSTLVTAVLIVVTLIILTGGLHLDGLADTADGFLSVSSRQRSLEIMKDSSTGAMGVIAIVSVLLVKVAAVASVPKSQLIATVLLMPVAGRCAVVIAMSILPYARAEGGLGSLFYEDRTILNALWTITAGGVVGWLALGWAGLAATGTALVVTILFAAYCYRKIGGITGDTLGATCELIEMAVPLVICICPVRS